MYQANLLKKWEEFSEKSKPRTKKKQREKRSTFKSANALYEGRELILNAFRSGIIQLKEKQGKGLKILTSKKVLERLPIALAQVKTGNTSENLLNEIRHIVYSLYR